VFKELERQAGIMIDLQGRMAGTLTKEFEALSLEQGLRRLFCDVNSVFFYAKGTQQGAGEEKLIRVWLFPREGRGVGEGEVSSPPLRVAAAAH
jgi:hypothetical protein